MRNLFTRIAWTIIIAYRDALIIASIGTIVVYLGFTDWLWDLWYAPPDFVLSPLFRPSVMFVGFLMITGAIISAWRNPGRNSISPLEIFFDPTNPAQRFWRRVPAKDKEGSPLPIVLWEYRVAIKNKSRKTVRNVRVSTESLGQMPVEPRDLGFQKDGKECRDVPPGYTELVPILWVWPPQPGDAWGPTATAFHGPIRIMARGDDVWPTEKTFEYVPEQQPALVARSKS